MLTHSQLITAFDHACAWNALLYSAHKLFATALTFVLFSKLDTDSFALYANVTSIIFLVLLWTDCGFRKSIARFLPEYEQMGITFNTTLHTLLILKGVITLAALPICAYALHTVLSTLNCAYTPIIYSTLIIFCAESLLALLQLIYHSRFLHKYFNTIDTMGLFIFSISAFLLCIFQSSPQVILLGLLICKIVTSIGTTATAYLFLRGIHDTASPQPSTIFLPNTPINKTFMAHSGIMWISTILKSLTERNALVPVLTYALGPTQANIFKIANEGALLFYRIALKTIGTNDTTVLTMARLQNHDVSSVFHHVQQKIGYLCLCISMIFIPICLNKWYSTTSIESLQLFFIITFCYLIEVLLSPYERILEVDQQYRKLFIAYAPYILFLIMLYATNMMVHLSLITTIALIHGIRLISSLLLMTQAKKWEQKETLSCRSAHT